MSTINRLSSRSVAWLAFSGAALVPAVASAQAAPAHAIAAAPATGVVPAEPQPGVAQATPGSYMLGPQADRSTKAEGGKVPAWPAPGAFVGVLRSGFMLSGGGQWESRCSSNAGLCSDTSKSDYDDGSQTMLGADALFQTTRKLRLGLGTLLVTDPTYSVSGGATFHSGTELTTQGVVEGVFPISARFALTLRAQIGAMMLFPGRDHEDAIHAQQDDCNNSGFPSCNVLTGPFVGPTGGVGFGGNLRVGHVGLRLELMSQFYSLKINGVEASVGGESLELSDTLSGKRLWLSAGVEL